jgi:hypothetical protein
MEFYVMTNMQVFLLTAMLNRHKTHLRMKLFQAVSLAMEAEILHERATVLCYT